MQAIEISEREWQRLLDLRDTRAGRESFSDPAFAVYAPIAGARGRFVVAQVGQSLDGRIATPNGDSRDVSGADGLAHLHRCRALVDAVIVGVTTVKADNPRLSVRMVRGPDPVRVVIDCHADLDGEEGLFHDGGSPVIVFRSTEAPVKPLPYADVIRLPPKASGLDPNDILDALSKWGLRRVLVEGGARTIGRFIDAGFVDRLHVAVSPIIIGSGPTGIRLSPIDLLARAHRPATAVYCLGSDILFDCCLKPERSSGRQGEQVRVADLA